MADNKDQLPVPNDPKKKFDLSDFDLRRLDLTRKYDDLLTEDDDLTWRDHMLLYCIGGMLLLFFLWASFTTLDAVARGEGKVVPSSQTKVIQSLEGGIIDEFLVRTGDEVKKDQVLLRIRNVQAKSDFAASNKKYYGILASTIRLQAEAEGSELVFPPEVVQQAGESVQAQRDAFAANRQQMQGQLGVLESQKSQKEQEVAELERRIADVSSVLKLTQDEKNMVEPMVAKGAAAKMEILQLDRQIAQQRAELNGMRLALPRSQSAVEEVSSRIAEVQSAFRAAAQKELAEKTVELNTIEQTLVAYQDKSERTEIRSPADGRVQVMHITTVGGVAKPGDPIMEIVPLGDMLVVEARIKPADIAFIHPGQKAIVRISAFDFSVFGALEGTVASISPDSFTTERGESYYRVQVETEKKTLQKGDKVYEIIPGMQATVDIITGERTVLQYLFKPFIKASQIALREK